MPIMSFLRLTIMSPQNLVWDNSQVPKIFILIFRWQQHFVQVLPNNYINKCNVNEAILNGIKNLSCWHQDRWMTKFIKEIFL